MDEVFEIESAEHATTAHSQSKGMTIVDFQTLRKSGGCPVYDAGLFADGNKLLVSYYTCFC